MGEQVQCPNCGGYRVESRKKPMMEKQTTPATILGRIMVLFITVIFLGMPLLWGRQVWDILLFGKITVERKVGEIYHHTCVLCGYNWVWKIGDPLPRVNVRPDLIQQGEQRLQQEEKKRWDDAAAAHYLWQQQHRK